VDCENNVEHHLHSSHAELYLADDLCNRDHSYENGPELPNFQTNNIRTIHYPQGCNDFKISVYSGLIRCCSLTPSRISSFVCQMLSNLCYGMVNETCYVTEN
jgi:hypothetical protein